MGTFWGDLQVTENIGWGTDGIRHIAYVGVSLSLSIKQKWEMPTWRDRLCLSTNSCEGYFGWHMLPCLPPPCGAPQSESGVHLVSSWDSLVATHPASPSLLFLQINKMLLSSQLLEAASEFCKVRDSGSRPFSAPHVSSLGYVLSRLAHIVLAKWSAHTGNPCSPSFASMTSPPPAEKT